MQRTSSTPSTTADVYTHNATTARLIAAGILPDPNFVPRETKVNRFGVMIWDHKTAGHCQVLSGESWKQARKYNVPRKGFSSVVKSITG